MRLDAIAVGNSPPNDLNVIVEVPVGGEPIKYELDKASGTLVVDRFLYTPMRYPGNYGFVPHTLSADGDPIDVLVCNTRAIVPGAVINCRPVGVLVMEDEGGGDEKIIAVPSSKLTARYEKIRVVAKKLADAVFLFSVRDVRAYISQSGTRRSWPLRDAKRLGVAFLDGVATSDRYGNNLGGDHG